jgi:putative transposase
VKNRGLASPLLVISDGAPGLIGAIEQAFPAALRQRCIIHRARNLLAKIPAGMQAEVKDAYRAIFDTEELKTPPGPRLAEITGTRISELAGKYQALYPAAARCLTADREGLTACLRFPAGHQHRIRHSNFISAGRSGRPAAGPGSSAGSPARPAASPWTGPSRTGPPAGGWRGLTMNSDGLRLLQDLRRSLLEPPAQLRPRTRPKRWIVDQYFGKFNKFRNDRWVFGDRDSGACLPKPAWTDIVRHTLVKSGASPDDPALAGYWAQRRQKVKPPLDSYTVRLLSRQDGRCSLCGENLLTADQPPQSPEQWER